MKERKYPFSLFVSGFMLNFFCHYFWLLLIAIIFLVVSIFVKWSLYVGIGFLLLDIFLSLLEQLQIRQTILTDSNNKQFSEFHDVISMEENVFENIRSFFDNKMLEYDTNEVDEVRYSQANELVNKLKKSIRNGMSLSEIISCFEKMCETSIDEDSILFETGTFDFTGKKLFYFTLSRQISNGYDEYYQVGIHIQYMPTKENKKFHEIKWSDSMDENIFDYIRKSSAFLHCSHNEYVHIDIFMDET